MAGQVVVMLGPSGAGKSLQSQRLQQAGWKWLSSGELLRNNPTTQTAATTGHLVDSKLVEQIINTALSSIDSNTNIVLDGFPREMNEAKWLEAKLPKMGRVLSHVFFIAISPEVSSDRLDRRDRADDDTAAQAAKWHDYTRLTVPVIEHYRHQGLLVELDGTKSLDTIAEQIARFVSL